MLLPGTIRKDSKFRLVRESEADFDITIDFVELEMAPGPVRFEDIADENKVKFSGRSSDINRFIQRNGGKTIYFEPGVYDIPDRMYIPHDGTKIVGAGMWYTTFNFTQNSDSPAYWKRGIYCNASNVLVEGISLTTVNNKRYYQNIDSQQVGKRFMWRLDCRLRRRDPRRSSGKLLPLPQQLRRRFQPLVRIDQLLGNTLLIPQQWRR